MNRRSKQPALPADDARWRIVDAMMRRHGYRADALIETLHAAQQAFGYLPPEALRFVAASLRIPLSKAYGVATFYHFFTLRPPARHDCVVCMGTACAIHGAAERLAEVEGASGIRVGQRTADGELSLSVARCVGTCGLAPLIILDGKTIGPVKPGDAAKSLTELVQHDGR